jgi:hypothetical protein
MRPAGVYRVIAERHHEARPVPCERGQRRHVQVIVVAVRHQNRVDRRQSIEADSRIVDADRPRKRYR